MSGLLRSCPLRWNHINFLIRWLSMMIFPGESVKTSILYLFVAMKVSNYVLEIYIRITYTCIRVRLVLLKIAAKYQFRNDAYVH